MTEPVDRSEDPGGVAPAPKGKGRRTGPTLPELLGEGASDDARNNVTWLIGLGAVIGFLLLISALAQLGGGR